MRRSRVLYPWVGGLVAVALGLSGAPEATRANLLSQGPESRVNTTTADQEHDPSVAMAADGRFVVAWESGLASDGSDGDDSGIYLQRFAVDGSPLGGEVQVNTTTAHAQEEPSVAIADNGQFMVVWQSHQRDGDRLGVYAQRYAADGTPVGGEFRVNTTTQNDQANPVVAMGADGRFVVAWSSIGQDGGGGGIYAKRYSPEGKALTVEFRVNSSTATDQRRPAIAMAPDGRFVVAWQSVFQNGDGHDAYARRYGSDGAAIGSEFRVSSNFIDINSQLSVAIAANGRFVVAWTRANGSDVYVRRYAADGAAAGGETRVNVTTTSAQIEPTVAMSATTGRFVVAWESYGGQDGDATGVFARRFGADGAPLGGEFGVNVNTASGQSAPAVAMAPDERAVVAWQSYLQDGHGFGVYMRQYEHEVRVNETTVGAQDTPAVAMVADGRLFAAWESSGQDGSSTGVYARRYGTDGLPLGGEFRVNTTTASAQADPAVGTAPDGQSVVAWESSLQDGSGRGIYAQRYAAGGAALGGEFRVNTTTVDDQENAALAMAPSGRFVVVWQSDLQDGDGRGVYAQRYAADGSALGSEFRVNTTTANDQRRPAVAVAADGRFAVAWESVLADGTSVGVFARAYDPAGSPSTGEFRLNLGSSRQQLPAIGMADDGRFAVAWQSDDQDGSGSGVYLQRQSATGSPIGGEVRANVTVAGDQRGPALAVRGDFGFVLGWESVGQDGSGSAVNVRQFGTDGTALTGELQANVATTGDQLRPAVGLGSASALVAWDSPGQDGDLLGVFAKRFEVTTTGTTGTFVVEPEKKNVGVGEPIAMRVRWTVPEPAVWRDLRQVQVRLTDANGTALWLRWREADDTWVTVDPATEREGARGRPGDPGRLMGPAAALELGGTRTIGSGPAGQHVDLKLRLTFLEAASKRNLRIEVAASGDAELADDFAVAGQLRVR